MRPPKIAEILGKVVLRRNSIKIVLMKVSHVYNTFIAMLIRRDRLDSSMFFFYVGFGFIPHETDARATDASLRARTSPASEPKPTEPRNRSSGGDYTTTTKCIARCTASESAVGKRLRQGARKRKAEARWGETRNEVNLQCGRKGWMRKGTRGRGA